MHRHPPHIRLFAAAASFVAGFVDAIGFLAMGGFFVSFMSGNTTRLGVGLASEGRDGLIAGALIAVFVAGATAGSLVARAAGLRRRTGVLVFVALWLAAGALLHAAGQPALGFAAMALAMGAENALFERDGDVQIGLTYMTGTLVKLGQRLAVALTGGPRWDWTPFLIQWLSLAAGALAGALAQPWWGLDALWIAVALVLLLAMAAPRLGDA